MTKQRDGLGPPPDFPCLLERLSHPSALLTLPWLPAAPRIKSKRRPLGPSPTWSPDPFLPSFRPATPALFSVALRRKVHSSLRTFALANPSVWKILHPNCQWLALVSQASAQRFPPQRQVPCPPASPHALFNLFRAQSTVCNCLVCLCGTCLLTRLPMRTWRARCVAHRRSTNHTQRVNECIFLLRDFL